MLGKSLVAKSLFFKSMSNAVKISKRNSSGGTWSYRVPPPMPRKQYEYITTGLGAICWWWIIYHCLTEPGHIFGEFPYVHPSTYTDEELGIPPDSEGSLRKKD